MKPSRGLKPSPIMYGEGMTKTAVCLLTADRSDLSFQTINTFLEFNNGSEFILLHADDASSDLSNMEMAADGGFETVYRNQGPKRIGQIPALRAMWAEAVRRGAEWILHLENDQEFVAPVPTRRDADQIRLYGEYKAKPGSPRDKSSDKIWGSSEKVTWSADGDGWERGIIHWGAQPSITRASLLVNAIERVDRVHGIPVVLNRLDTLRPVENITWHTDPGGTTPGHWLGKDNKCLKS